MHALGLAYQSVCYISYKHKPYNTAVNTHNNLMAIIMVMMMTIDNGDDHQYTSWTGDDKAEKKNK